MSRIGRAPIPVPSGVDVTVAGGTITVKGPKGTLSRQLPEPITVRQEDNELLVERPNDERQNRAMHGLVRSLVNNMVVGVSAGFTKELEIVGVGYRAAAAGPNKLDLALGFSHPVSVDAPEGITFETECVGKIYNKDEFDTNVWTLYGEPETTCIVNQPATVELTCATLVNRIPQLIDAPAGYVTTDQFPYNEYMVKPMNEYVKTK